MPIARVFLSCGRFHLAVAEVVIATQGDACRDLGIREQFKDRWDHDSLEHVAAIINAQA